MLFQHDTPEKDDIIVKKESPKKDEITPENKKDTVKKQPGKRDSISKPKRGSVSKPNDEIPDDESVSPLDDTPKKGLLPKTQEVHLINTCLFLFIFSQILLT